jgi:hypothetical protein
LTVLKKHVILLKQFIITTKGESMSDKIKESAEYDNFLEESSTAPKKQSLGAFVETKEVTAETSDKWEQHWMGMPAYDQEANNPFKKVTVSFRTKEDFDEFAKAVGQKLTDKTKSIWYPKLAKDANCLKRWMEDE